MLGRFADCVFDDDPDLALYEKINRVLDQWLEFVDCKRKEAVYYFERNSDEDDSDDDKIFKF
jgi:hypothetical protein